MTSSEFLIDLRLGRQRRTNLSLQDQPQPFSSDYYKDLTKQKYEVERCFEGGNFNYLRNLPDQIGPNIILENKKEKVI